MMLLVNNRLFEGFVAIVTKVLNIVWLFILICEKKMSVIISTLTVLQ